MADRMLDSTISAVRNALMFTPMLWAYASPSWYAPMGLAMRNVVPPVMPTHHGRHADVAPVHAREAALGPAVQVHDIGIRRRRSCVKSVTAEQM